MKAKVGDHSKNINNFNLTMDSDKRWFVTRNNPYVNHTTHTQNQFEKKYKTQPDIRVNYKRRADEYLHSDGIWRPFCDNCGEWTGYYPSRKMARKACQKYNDSIVEIKLQTTSTQSTLYDKSGAVEICKKELAKILGVKDNLLSHVTIILTSTLGDNQATNCIYLQWYKLFSFGWDSMQYSLSHKHKGKLNGSLSYSIPKDIVYHYPQLNILQDHKIHCFHYYLKDLKFDIK